LRLVLALVLEDQSNCPLPHPWGVLPRLNQDPTLSRAGAADKLGEVQKSRYRSKRRASASNYRRTTYRGDSRPRAI
jgi:hypothetical protein